MPKQSSSLNFISVVNYLEKNYPEINFQDIVDEINNENPYYVENIQTGTLELISLRHIKDTSYWFSNLFMNSLFEGVGKYISDPKFFYNVGKSLYQSNHFLKTAIGIPLLGPQKLLERIQPENKKLNRTKEVFLTNLGPGHVVIRAIHHKNIIVSDLAMRWGGGLIESYAKLAGATDVSVMIKCVERGPKKLGDKGQGIWDFEIRYKDPGILKRLLQTLIFQIPMVKKEINRANEIQAEHKEQIINRDRIIKEKTDDLKTNQKKILSVEKKNTELKLRSLSADLTNTEEREKRSIAEDLHDSVSQTLGLSVIKLKNIIDSGEYGKAELIETKDYIEQAVDSIRSLTFQLSPPVLHDFGLEAAIEWLVTDICNRYNLNLIFSNRLENDLVIDETNKINLFRSIRELTLNIIKHAQARNAKISLFLNNNEPFIKIEDDGIGFDPDRIFKRKMKSYGLYSVKERLEILGSTFKINSNIGSGTIIIISIKTITIKE